MGLPGRKNSNALATRLLALRPSLHAVGFPQMDLPGPMHPVVAHRRTLERRQLRKGGRYPGNPEGREKAGDGCNQTVTIDAAGERIWMAAEQIERRPAQLDRLIGPALADRLGLARNLVPRLRTNAPRARQHGERG